MVHIAHLDSHCFEVRGQVLRHLLGECRDKNALLLLGADIDFGHQIVELSLCRTDGNLGVEKSRGSDDLFCDDLALLKLEVTRGRADKYRLIYTLVELVKVERTVIICRGQTEAVVNKALFARAVSRVHSSHLRQRYV